MDFSERERRLIYEHELVHCKKRDYFFRQLVFWLCAIYWFNPGIYVLADYFVDVNEMACDEAVLKRHKKGMAYWYAMLIYRISVDPAGEALEVIKFTGCGKSKLERRIECISKKTRRKAYVVVLASVFIAAAYPAITLGASAGMAALQGYCAEGLRDYYSVEAEPQKRPVHQEYTMQLAPEDVKAEPSFLITPDGATVLSKVLAAGEHTFYGPVHLTAEQETIIHVIGDSGNILRAGLTEPEGSTIYVNSINSVIDHTFSVKNPGNYNVYLKNMGSSEADIAIMVLVRNKEGSNNEFGNSQHPDSGTNGADRDVGYSSLVAAHNRISELIADQTLSDDERAMVDKIRCHYIHDNKVHVGIDGMDRQTIRLINKIIDYPNILVFEEAPIIQNPIVENEKY